MSPGAVRADGTPWSAGAAGLGMYPFAALRDAYDRYWAAVHRRAPWLPAALTWDGDVHDSWTSADLVVGYSCGWPLVTRLASTVQVVGTFEFDVAAADGPTYRSVIVTRPDRAAGARTDLSSLAGAVAAVNGPDSLSGWVSLIAAVHRPGARWLGEVRWTGAHVDSVRAVRDGLAEVASIDSVSWAHLTRLEPDLVDEVVVVGAGPRVPCLPVVAAPDLPAAELDELREAMAAALDDPAIADAAAAMRVRRFHVATLDDYLPLLALAPAD